MESGIISLSPAPKGARFRPSPPTQNDFCSNELQKIEELSASESASEIKTALKFITTAQYTATTGESGVRNPFGVADTPPAPHGFIA